MKKLITIILLIAAGQAMGQVSLQGFTLSPMPNTDCYPSQKVVSTYDTTLLFKGVDTVVHEHSYVTESGLPFSYQSCLVLHDAAGYPDTWAKLDIICTICLRNCNVKESRAVESIITPYQLAKDRLNKITNK